LDPTRDMTRVTSGKSRVRESRMPGSVRAKPNGRATRPRPVARLSPLGFKRINMLGRYAFTLLDTVARGKLRPLRDPNAAGIDDA
jgi:hypothetical protein